MYKYKAKRDSLVAGQEGKAEGESSPNLVSEKAVAHQVQHIAASQHSQRFSESDAPKRVVGSHNRRKSEGRPGQGEGENRSFCRLATLFGSRFSHQRFYPAVLISCPPHHSRSSSRRPSTEMQPTSHTNASSTTVGTTSSSTPLVTGSDTKKVALLLHHSSK